MSDIYSMLVQSDERKKEQCVRCHKPLKIIRLCYNRECPMCTLIISGAGQ